MRRGNLTVLAAVCAALGVAMLSPVLRADEDDHHHAPTTQRSQAGPKPAARPVNLEHEMENMGRAFKTLKAQIADASKNESSIQLLQQMQISTASAKSVVPPRIMRLPEAERAEKVKDYHSMMMNLLRLELDAEEQLTDSDNTKAAKSVEDMDELQKKGHEEFRPKKGTDP